MSAEATATLCVLLLEDSDIDAELIAGHLTKAGLDFTLHRATDRKSFVAAIEAGVCEVILADYALPDFDGLSALTIARALAPDVPFVFVSGVVGEEFATAAIKRGATDYVLKRNLTRLGPAVERALLEARQRRERRAAEEALARSELRHRLAIEGAGLGVWSFDRRTGQLDGDARCRMLCGLDANAAVSINDVINRIALEDRRALRLAALRAARPGGEGAFSGEVMVEGADGRRRCVALYGRGLFEGDVCLRLAGVVRDVTEDRRARDELSRLNARLEAEVQARTQERDQIWRLGRDLFAIVDADGWIRQANPAWAAHMGYDPVELLSFRLRDLMHVDDVDGARQAAAALRHSATIGTAETRTRRAGGEWRWIAWTIASEADLYYLVGRDVTDERAGTEALEASNAQLRAQIEEREQIEQTLRQMQRLEAVGQLTSGVAHDFNNLLTVVLGNIGFVEKTLAGQALDPAVLKRIGHMRAAAERGASLTAQLLAFSRRQKLTPRALNLNDQVGGMRDLLQSTMGGAIRIETVLRPGLWRALVDPTQIEMIILNLAINSRDAMEVGGALSIETANVTIKDPPRRPEEPAPGDYVELSVNDTGPGMSDEVLAKVFEPFFTTKPIGKGSGLGLAQVFGFAKQSGGGVRIETRLGDGTSVKVYLPRATTEVADGLEEPRRFDVIEGGGATILVVDDDSAVREVTVAMLTEFGYAVVEAGSGQAALAILAERRDIDLLLADYAMPGMSGAETVAKARRLKPGLPCMFVTGYADLAALRDVGGQAVVQKPFVGDELQRKLAAMLAERSPDNVIPISAARPH